MHQNSANYTKRDEGEGGDGLSELEMDLEMNGGKRYVG